MIVSIHPADNPDLEMNLNQQNFHWLMQVLKLPYASADAFMPPADVKASLSEFKQSYYRAKFGADREKWVKDWLGFIQMKRRPAPCMQEVLEALGGSVVSLEPDWSNLGDPFTEGTIAFSLVNQLTNYVERLEEIADYCAKNDQVIVLFD